MAQPRHVTLTIIGDTQGELQELAAVLQDVGCDPGAITPAAWPGELQTEPTLRANAAYAVSARIEPERAGTVAQRVVAWAFEQLAQRTVSDPPFVAIVPQQTLVIAKGADREAILLQLASTLEAE